MTRRYCLAQARAAMWMAAMYGVVAMAYGALSLVAWYWLIFCAAFCAIGYGWTTIARRWRQTAEMCG